MAITQPTTHNDNHAEIPASAQTSDEMIHLKAKLDAVEKGRAGGSIGLSVEEARERLTEKFKNAEL